MKERKIIVISGPTASGKTAYSIEVAQKNNGVIINADSMQIYKGLPILSAQPTPEELSSAEHLLFSYLEPTNNCNVGLWLKLAQEKIEYVFSREKTPIIVGGTGMYISKLIDGISQIPEVPQDVRDNTVKLYEKIGYEEFYKKALGIDKDYTEKLNPNDKQRLMRVIEIFDMTGKTISHFRSQGNTRLYPREMFFHININPDRDFLYGRCLKRFQKLVEKDNVLDEVKNFINNNKTVISDLKKYSVSKTIGLAEAMSHLNGEITLQEFIEQAVKVTRNYAKRQYTWFNHQFDKFDLRIDRVKEKDNYIPIL